MTIVSSAKKPSTKIPTTTMSAEQAANTMKDIATRIREESARMRETVKVIQRVVP
jgi:hypothetical protein